ncbi:MAG: argininosuccinate lyase [Polyangiaceae bacterium]
MIAKTKATGGTALLPELLAYTSSLAHDRTLLREDLAGSLAHLMMLEAVGLVPKEDAAAIRSELSSIAREHARNEAQLPDEEDVHMAIEARLTDKLGERAGLLHTARSRNDQIALDLRLFVREATRDTLLAIVAALTAITERAKTDRDLLVPAYTHRQRAMPITGGYFWAAFGAMLARDVDAFAFALSQADVLPLGVGALAGTSLPIDREKTRVLLGFSKISLNGLDTVGDRDFELDFVFASARLMTHVGRIASDVIDFSSSEFGFLKLGDAIACGSSMMPQKKNPDLFELIRGKGARTTGNLVALLALVGKLPMGYGRDLQEDRVSIFESRDVVLGALPMLTTGISHVTFDSARCLAAIDNDYMQATDLAEAMVAKHHTPFRTAYRAVGALVKTAQECGVPLSQVTLAQAKAIDVRLDEDVLAAADPRTSALRKTSAGGTAPIRVDEQVAELENVAVRAKQLAEKIPSLHAILNSLIAK